ncbi:type II toxin-antitoxin system PemK/MazF family toxin [Ruania halotolerans]|uniref:type II toxin-antitoxin system PemK/MazF family toxin n=1 Tax=Ruania halotolerans TaxID=2897773 RepID=UPI001E3F38FD|nr:type II toxin-antitoxin system PemK/MazF family toxin [Ruania halotolerans]UFU04947.1 type II toxin-antitoxin system PemK/MazF family toxin [Ruania halotolerans]
MSMLSRAVRAVAGLAVETIRQQNRRRPVRDGPRRGPRAGGSSGDGRSGAGQSRAGVREFDGALPELSYTPRSEGRPDPGEVVWAWVPYDEDDQRGKDRPVLIIAEHSGGLLGLQLTSKDHDRDATQEARWGRSWVDVGSGGWDSQRRPSEVRLDRVLWLADDAVRREGAALERARFDDVAAALREHRHGD